ncbi:MAG: hypothetical protein WD906_01635 [Anaerolineales bacterium]
MEATQLRRIESNVSVEELAGWPISGPLNGATHPFPLEIARVAKIEETKGRHDENSGYVRLLGNKRLGLLISRVHATVIRTGNELERLLEAATPLPLKSTLDQAIQGAESGKPPPLQVVFSPKIRRKGATHGITGDIAVFDHSRRVVSIIEVKDGDTFDTKKASGELASMQRSARQLRGKTGYEAAIYFCSFNQSSKDAIVLGAKGRFSPTQVMTGKELCAILRIDYGQFTAKRQSEGVANLTYLIDQLASIPEVTDLFRKKFR